MKIAIIAPEILDLGWIWRIRELVTTVIDAAARDGDREITVALGIHDRYGTNALVELFDFEIDYPVVARSYKWEPIQSHIVARIYPHFKFNLSGIPVAHIPRDWGWNFMDCDAWLICADFLQGAILPLKPTFIYARDVSERYVLGDTVVPKERKIERLLSWRRCDGFILSDEALVESVVSYVGMPRELVLQVNPLLPAPIEHLPKPSAGDRIFCVARFPDISTMSVMVEAAKDVLRYRPDVEFVFGIDAVLSERAYANAKYELLEAEFGGDYPAISFKMLKSHGDWISEMQSCSIVLSAQNYPGESDDYAYALGFDRYFVGLETSFSRSLLGRLPDSASLFAKFTKKEISACLRNVIGGEAGEKTSSRKADPLKLSRISDLRNESIEGFKSLLSHILVLPVVQ